MLIKLTGQKDNILVNPAAITIVLVEDGHTRVYFVDGEIRSVRVKETVAEVYKALDAAALLDAQRRRS